MKTETNDTPRTDEACEAMGLKAFVVPVETSRQLERELAEKTNEVARLRELLNSSIAINKKWVPRDYSDYRKVEDIEQEARLAPATEEPVIQDSRITEPVSECQDCRVPLATAEQINKRCSPCMLKRKFETDGVTMDEWYGGFSKIESTKPNNEVSKIKEMVMDAAKRGDELAAHWKGRAEKAESIIKQLNHYAGIIEENHTSTDHVTTHVTTHVTDHLE